MEDKSTNSFSELVEELQGKFDKVLNHVQQLKDENESLRQKIALLEAEIEALRRENEEMRKNGIVLFAPEEKEELKNKILSLLERLNKYL